MKARFALVILVIFTTFTLSIVAKDNVENNKVLVTQFIQDFWIDGNLDIAEEIIADDFVAHFASSPDENWETYVTYTWSYFRNIFPDMTIKTAAIIGEGNMVAVIEQWGGTFSGGENLDLTPTNEEVWVNSVDFFRIEDNKIAEFWNISNVRSFQEQMGFIETEGNTMPDTMWDVTLESSDITTKERRVRLLNDTLAVNTLDADTIVNGYTTDAKLHWIPINVELEGSDAIRASWETTPPEHRIAPRIIVIEGNLAATLYTMLPAPGVRAEMAVLNRFVGDKIAEEWALWDDVFVMQQFMEIG